MSSEIPNLCCSGCSDYPRFRDTGRQVTALKDTIERLKQERESRSRIELAFRALTAGSIGKEIRHTRVALETMATHYGYLLDVDDVHGCPGPHILTEQHLPGDDAGPACIERKKLCGLRATVEGKLDDEQWELQHPSSVGED